MTLKIKLPKTKLPELCKKWKVAELSFFGSVVREDFNCDSDVDVLVKYLPNAQPTLWDHIGLQNELSDLLGRNVDLVERQAIEKSGNESRKISILGEAQVFYLDEAA